ncbi:MAG: aminoacetone oxidase family FAD-binding enzyme, partial [Alphaproteobacteria bacterium]|nr:aminoacetone oxidase family FAD-binding enzyme [Alphaproteobacteria bacterium]
SYADDCYTVGTSKGRFISQSLVIATGGLSIPKIGATPFGYQIAEKFGLNIIKPRAGLVPLTFDVDITQRCRNLTGISVNASVRANKTQFTEGMLFTHRGLSGPSILQISSYWNEGDTIQINMALDHDVLDFLKTKKQQSPKQDIQKILAEILPKRICESILEEHEISGRIADLSGKKLDVLANHINNWTIKPCGTEGYRTAEVTLGGVNTNELSSKTFEAKKQENLFFIGEVIDVTGHLGGFNFQWAWASGFAAGQYA